MKYCLQFFRDNLEITGAFLRFSRVVNGYANVYSKIDTLRKYNIKSRIM